jgi:serine protease inhibitor
LRKPIERSSKDMSQTTLLIQAYNACGEELFRAFGPGNVALSPYSIGAAMAMALAGARGETEREMIAVLKQQLSRPEIDAANATVLSILNGLSTLDDPQSATLAVANALMLTPFGGLVSASYEALVKDKYAAEVFRNATLDDVNAWVSRKTEGKIDRILDQFDPNSAAVLLNAVYFKARWAEVFSTDATRDEPFNLTPAQKVSVPMMRQVETFNSVARTGYRAIRLPYEVGALGMIIVLPDAIDGGVRLDADELPRLLAALRSPGATKQVALAMPRFKASCKAELAKVFQQAGMVRAFDDDEADFSGMTDRPPSEAPFAISEIVHRAVIDVIEEGTEAAAATAIAVRAAGMLVQQPEVFRVDHPFLFYVVDDTTGAVLFQGRIVDPR